MTGIDEPRGYWAELLAEAFANLNMHRQRSLLALLGIVIGSAAIVGMLTIGYMAQRETLKLFRHLGVDVVQIHAAPVGDAPAFLDRARVEGLPRTLPEVREASPLAVDRATVARSGVVAEVGLAGATAPLADVAGLSVIQGRLLTPVDEGSLVVVVGQEAAGKLGGPGNPLALGDRIRIRGYDFTVVGLLAPVPFTALDPTDFNDTILMPLGVASRALTSSQPDSALLKLVPGSDAPKAGARAADLLANPVSTLQVQSAEELIRGMNAQKAINARLLTAVGAISLIVGGIGIMNVLLMGVMERRREIGLRAALGARPVDLRLMFLVEASALAGLGGALGLLLGLAGALAAALSSGWSFAIPLWVVPLGPGVAALVGLLFGVHPAIRASRLDPLTALREA